MEIVRRYKLEGVRRYYKVKYSDKLRHIDLKRNKVHWASMASIAPLNHALIEVFSEKDLTKKDLKKFDMNTWIGSVNEYKNYAPFIIRLWTQRDLNDIMIEEIYLLENKTNDIWSNL